jgi:adenylate cyclase
MCISPSLKFSARFKKAARDDKGAGRNMFDLVAQGKEPGQRWRKKIRDKDWQVLGRQPGTFSVPWDNQLSRQHARFCHSEQGLEVEKIPQATNPIFFDGQTVEKFLVKPHQHFVIGSTRFTVVASQAYVTQHVPNPIQQLTFSDEFLQQLDYRDASQRIDVLSQLPALIADAANEEQLLGKIATVLLNGIPLAEVVGMVDALRPDAPVTVKFWDSRHELGETFQPSESLIREAVQTATTVLHVWSDQAGKGSEYTLQQHADWAFVCPLRGTNGRGQAIYVSGRVGKLGKKLTTELLHDDLKFAQLVTSTYANVVELESLQRRQAALRSFFSPVVVEAISGSDPDKVLEPRTGQLSVLFGDLRGFSASSERLSEDLLELLNRVSRSLGIMTSCILSGRGVVGDFHGDAVMGFWGWPLVQPDAARRAIQTALEITRQFAASRTEQPDLPEGLLMGLGIASGVAVAGKIGTSDQVKVTAFGPVVNLASRLEGMTRYFKVPILCDEATIKDMTAHTDGSEIPNRRLATVIPYGLHRATNVFQIFGTAEEEEDYSTAHLAAYALALNQFENKAWAAALDVFLHLADRDPAARFVADFIRRHSTQPPPNWNGAISMPGK